MARLEFTPDQIDDRIKNDPEMKTLAQEDPTEFERQHAEMYRNFGYKPDGSPLGAVQKAFGVTARATGIPEGVVKGVASAVIPTALTVGGAMAGAVSPIPGGTVMGAAGGAVAGEFANYGLGITEEPPTGVDLGVAAGSSLLGPLGGRAKVGIAALSKRLPGAGMAMHPLAEETLLKNVNHMRIEKGDVAMLRGLVDEVPDFKAQIPITRDALKTELDTVTRSLKPNEPYIKELNDLTKRFGDKKHLSFKEIMATEKDLIESGSADAQAVWAKLSGTMIDDLEAQAKNPALAVATREKIAAGAQQYKMYSAFNKRYQANDALDRLINRSVTQVEGGDDMVRFNKQQFLKTLRQDKVLNKTFEPTELADIEKAIEGLGYLAAPPGGGMNAAGRSIHAGAGGALGMLGYAVGGYSGMLVAGLGVAELLRVGVSSQTGRNVVKYLATKGKGRIDAVELDQMLGKVIAGSLAGSSAGLRGAGMPEGIKPFTDQE